MSFEISLCINSKNFFAKFGPLQIGNEMLPCALNKYGFAFYIYKKESNTLAFYWGKKEKWFGLDLEHEEIETLYIVDPPDKVVSHRFEHCGKFYTYHSGVAINKINGVQVDKPRPFWILEGYSNSSKLFDNFPIGLVSSPCEYPAYIANMKKAIEKFKSTVPN